MIDLIAQISVPTPKNPLPAWPMLAAMGIIAGGLLWLWGKLGPAGKILVLGLTVALAAGLVAVK